MGNIKIIGRINKTKNLYFVKYHEELLPAINNFKGAGTVKVIKGIVYIHQISLGYFTEILSRNRVSYSIITTLI